MISGAVSEACNAGSRVAVAFEFERKNVWIEAPALFPIRNSGMAVSPRFVGGKERVASALAIQQHGYRPRSLCVVDLHVEGARSPLDQRNAAVQRAAAQRCAG